MQTITVTGPRQLTAQRRTKALSDLQRLKIYPNWLIGDALGLDLEKLARSSAQTHHLINLKVYKKRLGYPTVLKGQNAALAWSKLLLECRLPSKKPAPP